MLSNLAMMSRMLLRRSRFATPPTELDRPAGEWVHALPHATPALLGPEEARLGSTPAAVLEEAGGGRLRSRPRRHPSPSGAVRRRAA